MQAYRETKAAEIQSYKVDATATPVAAADDIAPSRIVLPVAAGTIDYAVDGSAPLAGVTIDGGDIGVNLDVQNTGIGIVETSAAIVINAPITAAAGGLGVTAASGDYIVGYAKQAATGANQFISVQLELGVAP